MRVFLGVDLGSTTTKAVLLDERQRVLGQGITNSRSNYHLAADIAKDEALVSARFTLLDRELEQIEGGGEEALRFRATLHHQFRKQQHLSQLASLRRAALSIAGGHTGVRDRVESIIRAIEDEAKKPALTTAKSDFFRDRAGSAYGRLAEKRADGEVGFDTLMGVFDKAIIQVESQPVDLSFGGNIESALERCGLDGRDRTRFRRAVEGAAGIELEITGSIGTGYGRQTLPFPKEHIRSEILCHGLGAHLMYPKTKTVLDIGGQDTKAIQVDGDGIVTGFQMNDRCAAGCGRYLGYIADEMSLGLHELGPLALESTRHVKISSTCTVFAGAELRDRLSMGQKREDILAGLHRAIILRAMALLARSGGVFDEFTFTGGVANNVAAVRALKDLISENYGPRTINISPSSIFTGAHGAAVFALRAARSEAA
jgi:benzoyl-CoA reductase subunit A